MKRRNFLASLFALPFAAKPLEALASHYDMSAFSVVEDVDDAFVRLFDRHHREVSRNTEEIRRLQEALRLNAPTGWKVDQRRYSGEEVKALGRASKRYKKLPEKE